MHVTCEPSILYFGTPVVLVSSMNEAGHANLAPISSAFWLGWRCLLGFGASSKTPENLLRTGECVLNLPSEAQVGAIDRLALTTGSNPVPAKKQERGYRFEADKFACAGLTPMASQTVRPPRVAECPVQLEAVVEGVHRLGENDDQQRGKIVCIEVRVQRVHVASELLMPDAPDHIDPDRWRPLIMSFQKFYGLSEQQLHTSRLASIPEASYRSYDVERARAAPVVGASASPLACPA